MSELLRSFLFSPPAVPPVPLEDETVPQLPVEEPSAEPDMPKIPVKERGDSAPPVEPRSEGVVQENEQGTEYEHQEDTGGDQAEGDSPAGGGGEEAAPGGASSSLALAPDGATQASPLGPEVASAKPAVPAPAPAPPSALARFFSSLWGGVRVPAPADPAPLEPEKKAGARADGEGEAAAAVAVVPVAKDGKGKKVPDAEVQPVPEASVAALGDPSGQYFVASGGSEGDSPDGLGGVPGSGRLSGSRAHDALASVTLSDFDRISVLGKGSFGKVVLVEKTGSNGARYAMKVLKKSKLRRAKQVERTKTERRVLEVCEAHPFIMAMSYAFQTEEKLYIVLEYCSGGELFFHLSRYRKFPEPVARFYAAELVCALSFLHSHGIIYRDMKPENVLLDSVGHVKLGDFGLAKDEIWDPVSGARSICGTPEYMAPEVLNKVGHGQSVDWWGLGMILYEMLTGLPPWYTKDRQKLFQRLRYAPLRIPPSMSVECATCISALLCRNPAERLGARGSDEIKSHPFFTPTAGSGHPASTPWSPSPPAAPTPAPGASGGSAPSAAAEPDLPPPPPPPPQEGFRPTDLFDWALLEARQIRPPIDPMEGLETSADDRNNTANFDPQFTRLEIETDNEEDEAEVHYEHFDGFSFMGSGSLEVGSGDDIATGGSDELAPGEFWSRKRDSCPSGGFLGDVLIDPRPVTVEALHEEIRKLSSASTVSNLEVSLGDASVLDEEERT